MINVSNDFKLAMKQPVKEIQASIQCSDGTQIRGDDDLISYKISVDSGLCKTAMRKIEGRFLGNHNILGTWIEPTFGVKLADSTYEFINYGSFMVTDITFTKDTGVTSFTGYDKMINSMIPYTPLDVEYPINLYDYTVALCTACNLDVKNDVFGTNLLRPTLTNDGTNINTTRCTVELDGDEYSLTATGGDMYFGEVVPKDSVYSAVKGTLYPVNNATKIYVYCTNSTFDKNFVTFYDEDKVSLGFSVINNTFTNGLNVPANAKYYSVRFGYGSAVTGTTYSTKVMVSFKPITEYIQYNTMNDWQITQELWENIDGITYRDILVQIAQATCTTAIISEDKIYFKSLTDTNETLTYDNMKKWKLEPLYGEINSVVLSRTPQEDNIYMRDDESIADNGLTEWKIENNEIIDKDRDNAMTPIYNAMHGINYYPFDITTEGLGWYEVADNFEIENNEGDVFNTSLFNYSITIDGAVKETLKTVAETKTQTQYQYATTIAKRVKNTEIIVNKQEQYIDSLVTDMYQEDGLISTNFTQVHQDINNIIQSVQNSGGANLIRNSVMFDYDNEGNPNNWETDGSGTLDIQASTEALTEGGLSGHVFILNNKIVRQQVRVKADDGSSTNPTYYTFSCRIKKNITGSCYVKLYNSSEEHIIEVPVGTEAYYKEYELKALLPTENYYIIEFYGSADSDATFTDNMLAVGEYKTQWQQASGEVMNTQVNINLDGVLIKSSVYQGDYTVMSPLEFAGYSKINGVMTKVFSLNKDTTEVEKLQANKEIKMYPIKIVPITSGNIQGWAFVPTSEEV